jgi:hypothetical protein
VAEKENVLMKASAEAIQEVMKYVKATAEFTIEQAPDIARQFLLYEWTQAWIFMGTFAVIGVSLTIFGRWLWTQGKKEVCQDSFDNSGCRFFGIALGVIGPLMIFIGAVQNALTLIKISMAPKVYLLTELSKLGNG